MFLQQAAGLLGVVLVCLVAYEALRTTLAVSSESGPVTGRFMRSLWALALRFRSHRALRRAGLAIILLGVLSWFVGLWVGWWLTLLSQPQALIRTADMQPASAWERFYYVSSSLFSVGANEFVPRAAVGQLLVMANAASGVVLLTLGLSYLIPVVQAGAQKRQVAALISEMCKRPDAILMQAWDGGGFPGLEQELRDLRPKLSALAQQHLAYPVLHYYHSTDRNAALTPMVAVLDEMLTLLEHGVEHGKRPAAIGVQSLREAVSNYLDTLESAFIFPVEEPPPIPSLFSLQQAGIPVAEESSFERALEKLEDRRRRLRALVQNDGWSWEEDVWPEGVLEDRQGAQEKQEASAAAGS